MEDNNIKDRPRYVLSDIYNILYTLDRDSLVKISKGQKRVIDDSIKDKLSEIETIANEIGWDKSAITKAVDFVLQNMEERFFRVAFKAR